MPCRSQIEVHDIVSYLSRFTLGARNPTRTEVAPSEQMCKSSIRTGSDYRLEVSIQSSKPTAAICKKRDGRGSFSCVYLAKTLSISTEGLSDLPQPGATTITHQRTRERGLVMCREM